MQAVSVSPSVGETFPATEGQTGCSLIMLQSSMLIMPHEQGSQHTQGVLDGIPFSRACQHERR